MQHHLFEATPEIILKRSVSRYFASQGAKLVLNDLGANPDGTGSDDDLAGRIAADINAHGGTAVADTGDISDTATGQRLVDMALDSYGALDIVVNVAGILRDKMIFNLPDDDWDAVIRVHLRGHFSTIKPAAAYWRRQRNIDGNYRIINFTSDSALQASPGQPNYAAAKMGIIGFTGSLANALSRCGVTANSIAPAAHTRLTSTVPDDKRTGKPATSDDLTADNVAPMVGYIASTQSGWMSGRTIGVGGHEVKLWSTPQVVARVASAGQWDPRDLAASVEREFRPIAEGLPRSGFMPQIPSDPAR